VWTEWNALVADNVAQAADTATRSLQRGVFAGMRALGLLRATGWATSHAFVVNAFLVHHFAQRDEI